MAVYTFVCTAVYAAVYTVVHTYTVCVQRRVSKYGRVYGRARVYTACAGRLHLETTVYTAVYTDRVHAGVQHRVHVHVQAVYACTRPCT